MVEKQQRMSYRPALYVVGASFVSCILIWFVWGMYLYWNDIRLVNFLAAWIPFVLSLLLAFVPEHKMSTTKKVLWRTAVITVGFGWSVVLWHQQVIADSQAKHDQREMVNSAVSESNEHSDSQIASVRGDLKGVKDDVGGVKTDLRATSDNLSRLVSKSESDITENISKVGKPDPPEKVRLLFTLWPDDTQTPMPLLQKLLAPDADGVFTIDFSYQNESSTAANNMDVWIQICDLCEFAEEPAGFEKVKGSDERVRHRQIPILNPGVSFAKQTIKVKPKQKFLNFDIAFRYSCALCEAPSKTQQHAKILELPSLGGRPPGSERRLH